MNYPAHVFDDDYTGPRWQYGLRNRPAPGGATRLEWVPRGFIIGSHRPDSLMFWHGTLDYPFALTDEEAKGYELTFVADFAGVPMPSEEAALRNGTIPAQVTTAPPRQDMQDAIQLVLIEEK